VRPPTEAETQSAYTLECEASHGDSTGVPSFDSLVVFDQTDSAHHPFVLIKNLRTGRTERLLSENAMVSCRSPDGRYVACSIYKSPALSSVLVVIDLASGKRIDPLPKAMLESVKWSPDSRYLAFDARTSYGDEASLRVISFPEDTMSILDTTATPGEYDFVWSPDSRWLAVARPAGSFHYGDYDLSELWIVSRSGNVRCAVIDAACWEMLALAWVADGRIVLDRAFLHEGEEDVESQEANVVIELNMDESADPARPVQH
jgi:tricorn protease-like protein